MSAPTLPAQSVLASLLATSEPKIVYHYTSLAAMMSILKTQKIWASDIGYLNDVSERSLLLDIVDRQIADFAGSHELSGTPFGIGDATVNGDGPYVSSFSANGDSLNQWRSYCPIANGVSIGFKTECLKKAKLLWEPPYQGAKRGILDFDSSCLFKAVAYTEPSNSLIGDTVLQTAYEDAVKSADDMQREDPETALSVDAFFRQNVEAEASFYKHLGFATEAEYRLVLSSSFFHSHQLQFRCTRSSLIPYVSMSIPHSESAEVIRPASVDGSTPALFRWDAVAELVIGPTPNRNLTLEAVWRLLKSMGLVSTQLKWSTIPYRDW